jgi:hypothetical protein
MKAEQIINKKTTTENKPSTFLRRSLHMVHWECPQTSSTKFAENDENFGISELFNKIYWVNPNEVKDQIYQKQTN